MTRTRNWILGVLTLLFAFMELSGLPSALFVKLQIGDVDPFYWTLLVNFLLIGLIAWTVLHCFPPEFRLGLEKKGFRQGFQQYGYVGFLISVIGLVGYYVGLFPFDAHPSFLKVLIEGILYNAGLAIIEELYVRGLLLNILENLFRNRSDRTFLAVVLSSALFGLGHIPGCLGLPFYATACNVVLTICMGFYFGTIYRKSGNLWLPILFHFSINLGALPYCFSTFRGYAPLTLIILVPACVILGIYSLGQLEEK